MGIVDGREWERMNKVIAVDFDGTLCENAWPDIGAPKEAVMDYIIRQRQTGARIILWTNRSGVLLENAVAWCAVHGILFDAVNENLPDIVQRFGSDSRKVFADEYLDDKMIPLPEKVNRRRRKLR